MRFTIPFVLASQSPRRQHLLTLIGAGFDVVVSDVDEAVDPGLAPRDVVTHLALAKAHDVAGRHPEALVLGADTIVVLDGDILNKPVDDEDAARMLRRLSGRTHTVFTGIALVARSLDREVVAVEGTDVTFADLTDEEIEHYVASGSPRDKAGAYGIQDDRGALYVAGIHGDYYNVVGLPLHRLYRTITDAFGDIVEPSAGTPVAHRLRPNLSPGQNPA